MENEDDIKKKFHSRDRVVRAISTDGKFRGAVLVNTNVAKEAQRRHKLDSLATLMLARGLSASTLLASFLKGEERIVVEALGDGVIKKIFAEALQVGESRGYVDMNESPVSKDSALGIGLLRVSKVLYGKFEPVIGVTQLVKGDISTDLAYYLTQSEQIPSAVRLDVNVQDDATILSSTGLLVQALPGTTEKDVESIHAAIMELGSVADCVESGMSAEEILRKVLPNDIEILNNTPVDFYCRCSLDRFKQMLLTLGKDEVHSMHQEGQNELVCQYCSNKYYLQESDFEEMLQQFKVQEN